MSLITVVTPTYNRSKLLLDLYQSLTKQINYNFEWIIIDDGSTDDTRYVVKKFDSSNFNIRYFYKKNGGKHTALNFALDNIKTELLIIVDSDDQLTSDATEIIEKTYKKYKNIDKLCGFCFTKAYSNGKIVSTKFKYKEKIDNYINYIINGKIRGDKAEVFYTDIFREYKFPTFPNENFLTEGLIWTRMARKYNMVFIDYPIYICEYLDDGLTKSGRKLRIRNSLGCMENSREYLGKEFIYSVRFKNALLFLTYARFLNVNIRKLILSSNNRFLLYIMYFPSYFLYKYWKYKYKI